VVGLQLIDLRNAHWSRRGERQLAAWYEWPHQLASPVWSIALPHYDRLVLYPPPQCGVFPVPWEAVALLAGTHHLSINGGSVARFDKAARRNACHALERSLNAGEVRSDTMYLGNYARIRAFQSDAREPLTCGVLDGLGVCVTADSYVRWQDQASLK